MKICSLFFAGILIGLNLQAAQESAVYSYDASGRLIAAYISHGTTNSAALFAYDLAGNRTKSSSYAPTVTDDLDADGLNDPFSIAYFGTLGAGGGEDQDGDGLVNSNEFAARGNPTVSDTDQDGISDRDEFIAGTALNDKTEYFEVTNTSALGRSQLQVMYETKAGRSYQLQKTYNLQKAWTNQGAPYSAVTDGSYTFHAPFETNAYYRLEVYMTNP
jgi:hypothetical protein